MTTVISRRTAEQAAETERVLTFPERHLILWITGSVSLGVAADTSRIFSSVAALAAIAAVGIIGVWSRRPAALLAVMAYAASSDVLWRATKARAPWESSKYLVIFLSLVFLMRFVRRPRRIGLPIAMAAVLAPGAILTLFDLDIAGGRDALAFVLLGPIALAAATALFQQLILDRAEMRGLLWWAMAPCISMASVAAWRTIQAGDIEFGTESMFVTSGGYGPNQVSTIIGLGALFAVVIALLADTRRIMVVAAVLGVALIAQAIITLSRGGVYAFGLAAVTIVLAALVLSPKRSRILIVLTAGVLLGLLAVNWAEGFSDGAVSTRVQQSDTGRGRIASAEIELFRQNPLLGIGAGQAKKKRPYAYGSPPDLSKSMRAASHNEYSRLLAEHGILGIGAMMILAAMALQAFSRHREPLGRAIAAGFIVWSVAAMSHSATRLAAVSFVFALAAVRVEMPSRRLGREAKAVR